MKRTLFGKTSVRLLGLVVMAVIVWRSLFLLDYEPTDKQQFGVSFTQSQAEYLGLDWPKTYLAILDDLKVPFIRLGAYWNRIERQPGQDDFAEVDWLMDEAGQRGVKVMLTIGRRLPRWPECHVPDWAKSLSPDQQGQLIRRLLIKVVNRYKSHPALEFWQVENEPFLNIFGRCPKISRSEVKQELSLVKLLDPIHPTLTTDSGELASWIRTAHLGDYFGTTAYRVVYHPWLQYLKYNQIIPAAMYQVKAGLVGLKPERVMVTELQAEPWPPADLVSTPISEQFKSMDINQFQSNIAFAKQMGFPRVYLWGVEWWYWLDQQGFSDYWAVARSLLQ